MIVSAFCIMTLSAESYSQWVQTAGPSGGDFISISFNNDHCYAIQGYNNSALYMSSNHGITWVTINTPEGIILKRVFATDGYLFVMNSSGILRSTNLGTEWEYVNNGISYLNDVYMTRIGNTLFAASNRNVYSSNDFGINWTSIFYTSGSIENLLSADSFLLLSTLSNTYRSTNLGSSWNTVSTLTQPASVTAIGSRIFAAATNGLFYTTNSGTNWVSITGNLPNNSVRSLTAIGQTLIAGSYFDGIYRSTDLGANWIRSNPGLMNGRISSNCLISKDSLIIAATKGDTIFTGGIYFSGDSSYHWEKRCDDILSVKVIALSSASGVIFAGTNSGIYRSSDAGQSWQFDTQEYGIRNVNFIKSFGSTVYAGTLNGLFVSYDLGNSWTNITADLSNKYIASLGVIRDTLYLSNPLGIYVSGNAGNNWTLRSSQLKYSKDFILINDKIFTSRSGVYYSDNSGANWTLCGLEGKGINYLAMYGNKLFAGTTLYGIHYTSNEGSSWQVSSSEINAPGFAVSGSRMVAGVNISTNYGLTWQDFGLGFPASQLSNVHSLTISSDFVYAGTSLSVWRRSLTPPLRDVGISELLLPKSDSVYFGDCINGNSLYPKVTINNFGSESQFQGFGIECKIFKDYTPLYTDLRIDTIGAFQSHDLSFDEFNSTPGDTGLYIIKVRTLLNNDSVVQNDTLTSYFRVMNANAGVEPLRGDALQMQYHFANSTPQAVCADYHPTFNWEDTTGSITLISNGIPSIPLAIGNTDDGYFNIPGIMGENRFNFYYSLYDTFKISTNGIIAFAGTDFHSPNPAPVVGASPVVAVFPFWCDLDFSDVDVTGRNLKYKLFSDRLAITYDRVPRKNQNYDPEDYVSFQAVFWFQGERSGAIQFQYDSTMTGMSFHRKLLADSLGPHSIGINNRSKYFQHGIQYRYVNANRQIITPGPMFGSSLSVAFGINETVLPVELLSFTHEVTGNTVVLNWATGNESSNVGFEIERAYESSSWLKIGFVPSSDPRNLQRNYEFRDKGLNTGIYRYRLRQLDANGNFEIHELEGTVKVGSPVKFRLSQNYPNPFNPQTRIDFDLPQDCFVKLEVFDNNGKRVAILVNERRSIGYYTVELKGNNLSSSVYFYVLTAGSNVMTKKMILLK